MPVKPTVLVLDDDQLFATALALILDKHGFEAIAAFSGLEALSLANACHFDALVCDVVMAPMNGIWAAVTFRNVHPGSHVHLFTCKADAAQLRPSALSAGFDFRISPEPMDPALIIDELRAAWVPLIERRLDLVQRSSLNGEFAKTGPAAISTRTHLDLAKQLTDELIHCSSDIYQQPTYYLVAKM